MIDVFLSRPNWVPNHIDKHFSKFYPLLTELGFNPRTIGTNVAPIYTPFQDVENLMKKCQCTIVLGIPQIWVHEGKIKDQKIDENFSLPTEWNQIEAAISIMLKKPTLMMLHKGVAKRGLFQQGAANVFIHEFHSLGHGWVEKMRPQLLALKESLNA
ncbi:MAG: hypothetical protein OEY06_11100 [Gammaproteobacteria bacterium]|nr:hypothetical protein [Gammaproteobacteria bacterium]